MDTRSKTYLRVCDVFVFRLVKSRLAVYSKNKMAGHSKVKFQHVNNQERNSLFFLFPL
jgi:hypothetical protein